MKINYNAIQAHILKTLTENGIACQVKAMDGSTQNTVCMFDVADWANVDDRQNPTAIIGLRQVAYIPGNIAWLPDPNGTLTYTQNGQAVVRRVAEVSANQPAATPLMYTLVLQ